MLNKAFFSCIVSWRLELNIRAISSQFSQNSPMSIYGKRNYGTVYQGYFWQISLTTALVAKKVLTPDGVSSGILNASIGSCLSQFKCSKPLKLVSDDHTSCTNLNLPINRQPQSLTYLSDEQPHFRVALKLFKNIYKLVDKKVEKLTIQHHKHDKKQGGYQQLQPSYQKKKKKKKSCFWLSIPLADQKSMLKTYYTLSLMAGIPPLPPKIKSEDTHFWL